MRYQGKLIEKTRRESAFGVSSSRLLQLLGTASVSSGPWSWEGLHKATGPICYCGWLVRQEEGSSEIEAPRVPGV